MQGKWDHQESQGIRIYYRAGYEGLDKTVSFEILWIGTEMRDDDFSNRHRVKNSGVRSY